MRRLLKFFALQTLRVLAVVTVIAWGASQVSTMYAMVPFGSAALQLGCFSDGWFAGLYYDWGLGLAAGIEADRPGAIQLISENTLIPRHAGFVSGPLQSAVAFSYPFTLLLLVATYAAFWYFSRRRQRSLQSKLADAAKLH
ncbi:hypothetical protein [Fuerstiella marisgermanici]|uniref:Uncharacterized protein n=1 Tax=Fuerstiella marisgermanici TaxID=1891926 RepID=A0A1P8WBR2_9PLAN|nr:hypothetical protein [Fuerstiella marisgermanici]APZ91486.1 hypothetical protein Fuma_01074 [Fuerstiella marisgermanici]